MCWYLSIIYMVVGSGTISTSSTTMGPSQTAKVGPMFQQECADMAAGIQKASPNWHAQCEMAIPGGSQIQFFSR